MRYLLAILALSGIAHADCLDVPVKKVALVVKECRTIDPDTDERIRQDKKSERPSNAKLYESYRGALIVVKDGGEYVYPTKAKTPCAEFPPGKKIEKMADHTCCDTGRWGKCLFGGGYLWDVGATPVNVFQ